jgi:hypothetical protein
MLVPQNRIVKEVDREYLNILSCLAICEIKDLAKRCICQQPLFRPCSNPFSKGRHAGICLGRGHANLYNGAPLSLTAKPQ